VSDAHDPSQSKITPGEMTHLVGLLNARRYAESESRARALLREYPNCGFSWKALGISLWMQGKDSRPIFYRVTSLHPQDAEAHSNLGQVLLEFGALEEAAHSCRRALTLDPTLAEAHCNLGNALRRLGHADEAIASYHAALQLQPQFATAHNNLGNALQATGRVEEAVASFRNALEARADFAEAHSNLGNALLALNRHDEALASYRRALELRPEYAQAHNNLGNALLALGEPDEALHSCLRALELNPTFAEAHNNLGNAYRSLGQVERALESYGQALAIKPDYVEAHRNLGSAALETWRIDQAIASYRRALEIKPDHPETHNSLAIALLHVWQIDEAMALCRRALELRPGYAEAANNLGTGYSDLSQTEQAETWYRQALTFNPDFAEAHASLGFALRRLQRPEEAEACARSALAINPQLIEAQALLAELTADQGDFVTAERILKEASSREPDAPSPLANIAGLHKMTHEDAEWLASVRRVLSRPLPPRHEVALRYALGKYFEDLGDADEAFAQYRRANDLSRQYKPKYDAAGQTRTVDLAIETYNEEWVNRARRSPQSARAVFVVGAQRSGTTLAEQILASHPAVFGAGEQVFWSTKSLSIRPLSYDSDLSDASVCALAEEYLQRLGRLSSDATRVVDKLSGNYMFLGLIHAALPHARFIHMRRDPIDSCLSIYCHPFSLGHPYTYALEDLAHYYREYTRLMAHWRSILPRDVLLEVPYEGLVADPEYWNRKMIDFIGLPWDARCMRHHETNRPVIVHNSRWQVRQRIFKGSVERWRRYEKYLAPLLPLAGLDGSTSRAHGQG
jgi:tetratricopeptide (TPR) repeat protein